ncbi:hypothetical protein [Rhodococcus sp. UNC363MFTsu5.1]|uniref:hypothetical protein n=1 Tax=Rhodococcus sp. UNC363MFTsu5.1 TaxID=1449069 RepID=UPI001E4F9283|nr:hypothetical protein [Rhodococcus sp. UNC363MFTsu5.1]
MGSPKTTIARMRGAFVGSTSGAVSVAAHALGGGTAPTESSVVLLVLGCAAIGAAIASVRVDRHQLLIVAAALTLGQAIGHVALAMGAVHPHGPQLGPAMVAAHAAAVAVSALLIRAGERGCVAALSALTRRIPAPFVEAPVPGPVADCVPSDGPMPARWLLVGSGTGTRGPPQST